MAPESRTVRSFFTQRLAQLHGELRSMRMAAVVTEDGLLAATDQTSEPNALDRRGAVTASFIAVARTTARELQLDDARSVIVDCLGGLLVVRSLITTMNIEGQAPTTRRRLLFIVFSNPREIGRAMGAARRFADDVQARLGTVAPKQEVAPAAA